MLSVASSNHVDFPLHGGVNGTAYKRDKLHPRPRLFSYAKGLRTYIMKWAAIFDAQHIL